MRLVPLIPVGESGPMGFADILFGTAIILGMGGMMLYHGKKEGSLLGVVSGYLMLSVGVIYALVTSAILYV